MRWTNSILLLLLFTAVYASSAFSQTAVLQGRVTDAETGDNLVGSNIILAIEGGGIQTLGSSSGQNGEYVVRGISARTYTITFSFIGYETVVNENVSFTEGETKQLNVSLSTGVIEGEQIVVSASRRREKVLESPASVTVIETAQIQNRMVLSPVEHLAGIAGVDIVKTGLNQANVVVRGFNNAFSGALLSLIDNRIARVPSLRFNAYNFISTTNEDIERMEIVRGPGSALYGPNSANGVLHTITKSPFGSEGTQVNIGGGERSVFTGSFRHAGSVNSKFGYRFSFSFLQGDDFESRDLIEDNTRDAILEAGGDPGKIAKRNFDIEKISGDVRFDIKASEDVTLIVNGGFNRSSSIELTGAGAAQAEDWVYGYFQGRFLYKSFFFQVYSNISDASDSYLLREGRTLIDKSTLTVIQAQNTSAIGSRQSFTYGFDALQTRPDTEGSINGVNEDDDDINEYGYYVQSETRISEKLKLVAAARVDDNSRLPDPVFSPRAGLVFTPDPVNSFRLTFNRAFSTPSALNLFLDLNTRPASATQPFNIRLQGVPASGFTFSRTSTGLGGLFMQPLFVGAPTNSAFLPADATLMWNAAIQVLFLQSGGLIDLTLLPAPSAASVGTVLRKLNTTTGGFDLVGPESVVDIAPMKPTITNTIEAGYKGIFGGKFLANIDVYYSKINDFIGPLRVETPNVFFDPASLAAYLANPLFGIPIASIPVIVENMAKIPVGTIEPEQAVHPADLLLTYRNFGDIDLSGIDLGFTYYINRNWNLGGMYSYVSKDLFKEDPTNIALNAPQNKIGASLQYKYPQRGFDAQVRFRWVDGFPVNSGVFIGDVESFGLLDINSGIDLGKATGVRLTMTIQNLLDNEHREFIGAPEIGRVALLRLGYSF